MQQNSAGDLAWLLDDLVGRVKQAEHAIVLSADGLLMASSAQLSRDDAEHLAAMASGIQSLAKGASKRFGGGPGQRPSPSRMRQVRRRCLQPRGRPGMRCCRPR